MFNIRWSVANCWMHWAETTPDVWRVCRLNTVGRYVATPVEEVEAKDPANGCELIRAERWRQSDVEGYDAEHDDGDLIRAAKCYAEAAWAVQNHLPTSHEFVRRGWPWEDQWWKPTDDPIRNLVKAGALIAAEIDRLQRKSPEPQAYDPALEQ